MTIRDSVFGRQLDFHTDNTVYIENTTALFFIQGRNGNNIKIYNSTIHGGVSGLQDNNISVNDVKIIGIAGSSGALINGNNTINIEDTSFSGDFSNVINITAAGNTLSGGGNSFDGTFSNKFCEVSGAQTGSLAFSSASPPVPSPTTCPPQFP